MRTNIVLDDELVREALALAGVRTKRELVHLALEELVGRRKACSLLDLAGRIEFREDYDHREARRLRDVPG